MCYVKDNAEASSFSQSLTSKIRMLYFALAERDGLGMWSVKMEELLKHENCREEAMHAKENLGWSIAKWQIETWNGLCTLKTGLN